MDSHHHQKALLLIYVKIIAKITKAKRQDVFLQLKLVLIDELEKVNRRFPAALNTLVYNDIIDCEWNGVYKTFHKASKAFLPSILKSLSTARFHLLQKSEHWLCLECRERKNRILQVG